MKKDSLQQYTPLCKQALTNLISEEEEILAINFINAEKTFHSVDLWNIHRQRKGVLQRRSNKVGV